MSVATLHIPTYLRIKDDPLHGERRELLCKMAMNFATLNNRQKPNEDDLYCAAIYLLSLAEEQETR